MSWYHIACDLGTSYLLPCYGWKRSTEGHGLWYFERQNRAMGKDHVLNPVAFCLVSLTKKTKYGFCGGSDGRKLSCQLQTAVLTIQPGK